MALEAWNGRATGQTDADSPLDVTLMDGMRKDLDHLRQVLYGSTDPNFHTPAWGHNHDGVNSKGLGGSPCMGTHFLGILNMTQNSTGWFTYLGGSGSSGEASYYPHSPVTIRDLFVSVSAAPPAGQTFTVTLQKNGVDTALTATITSAGTLVSNTANAVDFGPQDRIAFKCVSSATTGNTTDIVISYRHLQYGTTYGEGLVPFSTLVGGDVAVGVCGSSAPSLTAANCRIPLARAAVLTRLISTAAMAAAADTMTKISKNGATAIEAGHVYNAFKRLIPGFQLAALDDVILNPPYNSGGVAYYADQGSWGLGRMSETDETRGLLCFGSLNHPQATTRYMNYLGVAGTATESEVQIPVKAGTLKNLALLSATTPAAGQTWTATVRKNGVDTALTVTLNGAVSVAADTTNTVTVADGDLISVKVVSSATTGTRTMTASVEHVA